MIFLNPPYHTYKDIVLLPDHENDKQYYYLPISPHVSFVDNEPRFQFWKFRSRNNALFGGLLSFEVDLGIDEETRQAILEKLAEKLGVASGKINLAAIHCVDGTTQLSILGQQSAGPNAPAESGVTYAGMVKAIATSKPSLYGDNKAIFSARVDQYGASFIEQTLDDYITPVSIFYNLSFNALKPAYQTKISADWEVVKKTLREAKGSKSWVAIEISNTVEEMRKKGVISVERDIFVTDTDAPGIKDRELNFVTAMTDFITDKFFVAALAPVEVEKAKEQKPDEGLLGVVKSLTDFLKPHALFFLDDVKMETTNIGTFDAQMRERITLKQSVNPNAYLSGLYQAMKRRGVTAEELKKRNYVKDISLDDDFFRNRKVTVSVNTGGVAFRDLGITTIGVWGTYNGERKPITLATKEDSKDMEWNSELDAEKRMKWPVAIECTVNFLGTDEFARQRPVKMTRKLTCETENCVITPNGELFVRAPISVDANMLPWERYSAVQAELRHIDQENKLNISKKVNLTQNAKTAAPIMFWAVNEKGESIQDYEYRLGYTAKSGQGAADKQTEWQRGSESTLYIRDPWPNKVTLRINAEQDLVKWEKISSIQIAFRYIDIANNIDEKKKASLTKPAESKAEFTMFVTDPQKRTIEYDVEVKKKGGGSDSVKGCFTDEESVDLEYPNLRGKAYVDIGIEPGSWDSRYGRIDVELRSGPIGGETEKLRFDKDNYREAQRWNYEFPANSKPAYEYRLTYCNTKGQSVAIVPPGRDKFQQGSGRTLAIPRAPKK